MADDSENRWKRGDVVYVVDPFERGPHVIKATVQERYDGDPGQYPRGFLNYGKYRVSPDDFNNWSSDWCVDEDCIYEFTHEGYLSAQGHYYEVVLEKIVGIEKDIKEKTEEVEKLQEERKRIIRLATGVYL